MQWSSSLQESVDSAVESDMRQRLAELIFNESDALYALSDIEAIEQFLEGKTDFLLVENEDGACGVTCFAGDVWAPFYAHQEGLEDFLLFALNKHAFRGDRISSIGYSSSGLNWGPSMTCWVDYLEFRDVAFVAAFHLEEGRSWHTKDEMLTKPILTRMATANNEDVVLSGLGSNWTERLKPKREEDLPFFAWLLLYTQFGRHTDG